MHLGPTMSYGWRKEKFSPLNIFTSSVQAINSRRTVSAQPRCTLEGLSWTISSGSAFKIDSYATELKLSTDMHDIGLRTQLEICATQTMLLLVQAARTARCIMRESFLFQQISELPVRVALINESGGLSNRDALYAQYKYTCTRFMLHYSTL